MQDIERKWKKCLVQIKSNQNRMKNKLKMDLKSFTKLVFYIYPNRNDNLLIDIELEMLPFLNCEILNYTKITFEQRHCEQVKKEQKEGKIRENKPFATHAYALFIAEPKLFLCVCAGFSTFYRNIEILHSRKHTHTDLHVNTFYIQAYDDVLSEIVYHDRIVIIQNMQRKRNY